MEGFLLMEELSPKPTKQAVKRAIKRLKQTIEGNEEVLWVLKLFPDSKDQFLDNLTQVVDQQKELLKLIKNMLKEDLLNE